MKRIFILLIIFCTLSACSATPEIVPTKVPDEIIPPEETIPSNTPTPETTTLDEIIVVFDNLFPEGIEYDENGERFLLGSIREQTVFQVFDDGTIEPFIEDPDLIECVGLEIDRKNQRLLVVNINEGEGKSYLNSYDLATGERIFISDISSIKPDLLHIANDVAVDSDGNAYLTATSSWLTDEGSPAIYRVDMEGNPTLFMEHTQFKYLNGIVYHPNGFLLLGSYPGLLLKIPIDNPEVIRVDITDGYWGFENTDGMIMHPDGTLIMVTFPDSIIGRLQSDDNWETAHVVGKSLGHHAGHGTTIALRGEEVYVIYSHLDGWGLGIGKQSTFEIVRVKFE